jgi:hypothetical protein
MALRYTTVQNFWKFIGINESVLDFQPGNKPERETVQTGTVTAGDYYLNQLGVNEDTLVLYVGGTNTALTLTTDYTFDSDTSKVTITSDGATALGSSDLTAVYEFSSLGKVLNFNETTTLLEQAENRLHSECNTYFADQSLTAPAYLQINDELLMGQGWDNNLYSLRWGPVAKLQTTVDGAYTTGAYTIDVVDASGFPASGTIYIGGNKVTYSSKSNNTLTIPDSTPSIEDGAVVRGEVVEVSTTPTGITPTYQVIIPDQDYSMDYDTGQIQLMDEYYFASDTWLTKPQDGVSDRVRLTYNNAWHEVGQDAEIPDEIVDVVHMMAGRKSVQRTILKGLTGQRDNFNTQSFAFSKTDIQEIIQRY